MFYVHMTNVTETVAMRGILSSGKCALRCTEACSDMSISVRLNIQSQSTPQPSGIRMYHMLCYLYFACRHAKRADYRRLPVVRHLWSNVFGPIMWKPMLLCCKSIPSL